MTEPDLTAEESRDVRGLEIALFVGVVLGAIPGILRYGVFTMGNVTLMGLGVIVSVSTYAAIVALLPARPVRPTAPPAPPIR